MTAVSSITRGLYADRLPVRPDTAFDLARKMIRIEGVYKGSTAQMPADNWRRLDDLGCDVTDAFFAALERETGITRDMFRRIGGLA